MSYFVFPSIRALIHTSQRDALLVQYSKGRSSRVSSESFSPSSQTFGLPLSPFGERRYDGGCVGAVEKEDAGRNIRIGSCVGKEPQGGFDGMRGLGRSEGNVSAMAKVYDLPG